MSQGLLAREPRQVDKFAEGRTPRRGSPVISREREDGMHPTRRQIILTFVAAFGLTAMGAGCASGGGEGGESGPRQDPNLLTAEDLVPYANLTCLEAVRQLRPRWLQGRGGTQAPIVVRDGNRMGRAESVLATIRATDVESLRYFSARDAVTRYGATVTGGAIEVITRRR